MCVFVCVCVCVCVCERERQREREPCSFVRLYLRVRAVTNRDGRKTLAISDSTRFIGP